MHPQMEKPQRNVVDIRLSCGAVNCRTDDPVIAGGQSVFVCTKQMGIVCVPFVAVV